MVSTNGEWYATCSASVVDSGCPAPVADGRYQAVVVHVDGRRPAPAVDGRWFCW